MTGLLPLSVQRIFKNLNKIRRKVFHVGEGSLNTLDEIRKPFFRLGNSRKSRRREKCQKKHQKIPHIVESTPSEQHRSMRRRTTGNGLFCALSVSSVLLVFCSDPVGHNTATGGKKTTDTGRKGSLSSHPTRSTFRASSNGTVSVQ